MALLLALLAIVSSEAHAVRSSAPFAFGVPSQGILERANTAQFGKMRHLNDHGALFNSALCFRQTPVSLSNSPSSHIFPRNKLYTAIDANSIGSRSSVRAQFLCIRGSSIGANGDGEEATSKKISDGKKSRQLMEMAAGKVQMWLEEVYESIDYEAALIRAGVLDPLDPQVGEEEEEQEEEEDAQGPVRFVTAAEYDTYEYDDSYLPMDSSMTIDHLHSGSEGGSADISDGKDGELTYGEMDLAFFLSILKYVGPPKGRKFVDVGCGRGQLVLAAALIGGWSRCEGIEIMADVLEIGRGALALACGPSCPSLPRVGMGGGGGFLHCQLHLGDMYVDTEPLRDADVILAYATCFVTEDGESLSKLSKVEILKSLKYRRVTECV